MHRCHAVACGSAVKPEFLMCYRHWRMVPLAIQRRVWAHYRVGQCDDKKPSLEWCRAADEAVACVASKEGRAGPSVTFASAFHPGTREVSAGGVRSAGTETA